MKRLKCNHCKTIKSVCEFYKNRNSKNGINGRCKSCSSELAKKYYQGTSEEKRLKKKEYYKKNRLKCIDYTKKWRNEHFERYKKLGRITHLKRTFNLSVENYENMFKSQNGACAICCTQNTDGKILDIDHDHFNGKIRGLLCRKCNVGLGAFGDKYEILEKALNYLREHHDSKI